MVKQLVKCETQIMLQICLTFMMKDFACGNELEEMWLFFFFFKVVYVFWVIFLRFYLRENTYTCKWEGENVMSSTTSVLTLF